jgi:hypothetical protein
MARVKYGRDALCASIGPPGGGPSHGEGMRGKRKERKTDMKRLFFMIMAAGWAVGALGAADYAVVVPEALKTDAGWMAVAETLQKKHDGSMIFYDGAVTSAVERLKSTMPHYACFVQAPLAATREFVAAVHAVTRALDDDPYTDCLWGILTGYDASNALRIARQEEPLTVRKAVAGTELEMKCLEEGRWYCELNKNKSVVKEKGGEAKEVAVPDDTTALIVRDINEYRPDLIVTSGHATERDWQIGYRYRNGQFRSEAGKLFGLDVSGKRHAVESANPKVYLPVGNCLMGHIDGLDSMALAWMNSAGVDQMVGYTVSTWYGYSGWGLLDYFVELPGRFTLSEAFFANMQALLYRLEKAEPGSQDRRGLEFDRDVIAFYGDPAWEARLAKGPVPFDQELQASDGTYTFEIKPLLGEKSFDPVNRNGSQRGGRPFFALLPRRVKDVKVVEGADLEPLITDNFILVPRPASCDTTRVYRVAFTAATL